MNSIEENIETIEPTTREITDLMFRGAVPDSQIPDEARTVTYNLCRLLDGFRASNVKYDIGYSDGWFQAGVKKEYGGELLPVGLKIHIAIPWDHPEYLATIKHIALLCLTPNRDGRPTSFKVLVPLVKEIPDLQRRKSVTIWPHYLHGADTNTQETIRLVAGLRQIMTAIAYESDEGEELLSSAEHQSGPGIYIRPGALNDLGDMFEIVSKRESFERQLENLDGTPYDDPFLFRREISAAIASGEL